MAPLEKITQLLGGRRVLGKSLQSQAEFIPLLREGLPYQSLEAVTNTLDLSIEAVATWLKVPRRSLARHKEQNRLDSLESERVVRLADIAAHATTAFGSVIHAREWLITGNRALGGAAPIALLDTDVGTRMVEDVLHRVDHGVHS
jgi:putative toxin-antitoxin system antitoxin component (TIGR02293 family)